MRYKLHFVKSITLLWAADMMDMLTYSINISVLENRRRSFKSNNLRDNHFKGKIAHGIKTPISCFSSYAVTHSPIVVIKLIRPPAKGFMTYSI
jgi:hypothetical protein